MFSRLAQVRDTRPADFPGTDRFPAPRRSVSGSAGPVRPAAGRREADLS